MGDYAFSLNCLSIYSVTPMKNYSVVNPKEARAIFYFFVFLYTEVLFQKFVHKNDSESCLGN